MISRTVSTSFSDNSSPMARPSFPVPMRTVALLNRLSMAVMDLTAESAFSMQSKKATVQPSAETEAGSMEATANGLKGVSAPRLTRKPLEHHSSSTGFLLESKSSSSSSSLKTVPDMRSW